ncbi:P1 [Ornithogalum virus 5]|uniref:P1 n=1 Tax=Ornithogalum virus 5 TaxID=2653665 RepID=A0A648N3V4_9VIRU|nr:P1 [Ornithogalum virus 5]
MSSSTISVVLFFLFSLFFVASPSATSATGASAPLSTFSPLFWDGALLPNATLLSRLPNDMSSSTCVCPDPPLGTSLTYNELMRIFSEKACSDIRSFSSRAMATLSENFVALLASAHEHASRALESFLWIPVALFWTSLYYVGVAVWVCLTQYTAIALAYLSVGCFIALAWNAAIWVCSRFPLFLLCTPFYVLRSVWKTLSFKRSSVKVVNEKAVDGYVDYSIPQDPPRGSTVRLLYPNGNPLGYATCVRLFNGENALITSYHCVIEEGVLVHSTRTGNKLPLSLFKPLYEDQRGDLSIMCGPPNWEGLMGCKGVHAVTCDRLGRGPATFFVYDNSWKARSAQIAGRYEDFAQVLSNTEPGVSGAGYFSGKTLLGVHKGHTDVAEHNFNLMSPLPCLPGLTAPIYVYETTNVQGRIFDEDFVIQFKKGSWFDKMIEHAENHDELPPLVRRPDGSLRFADEKSPSPKFSGNEAGSAVCPPNEPVKTPSAPPPMPSPSLLGSFVAPPSDTPATVGVSSNALQEGVLKALVAKFDFQKVEQNVAELIAAKMLSRPQRTRGTRGRKRSNSKTTSPPSTSGQSQPPLKPQASKPLAGSPRTTTPPQNERASGGKSSPGNIPSWVRKPKASAGQGPAQKRS